LHASARYGHRLCVQLLLNAGAYFRARNKNEQTAANEAQSNGHYVLAAIIDCYSALNTFNHKQNDTSLVQSFRALDEKSKNEFGPRLLHQAAYRGELLLAQLLLEAGVDKSVRDRVGQTAADIAHCNTHYKLAAMIKNWPEQ
jgi:ankyrin repeat protein